jgi:nicotinamidase-related amidase
MEILETLDELVDPKHTALIMWDFAKRVISNSFNSKSLVQNSVKLLQAARDHNVLTIYSRQNNMHLVGDTGAPAVRMRMKRQNKSLADLVNIPPPVGPFPTPELVAEVDPQEGDIIFEKFTPNAFLGTCFEWWLRKYAIKTIILTGVNVATGINGTAREALNLGYYAVVARDCVGTRSQEDYKVALASMERLFDVVNSTEIIKSWKRTAE